MYTVLVILAVIVAILLTFIVLIQESKGGGLASNFSSTNSIMGVRKTTNFVEKATWGLAIAMVLFSIVCAYTAPKAATDGSVLENAATQQQSTNAANTQGFGAAQAPAQDTKAAAQDTKAPAAQGSEAPAQNAAPAKTAQ